MLAKRAIRPGMLKDTLMDVLRGVLRVVSRVSWQLRYRLQRNSLRWVSRLM